VIGSTLGHTDYRDTHVAVVVSVSWLGRVWRLSSRALTGSDVEIDLGLIEPPEVTDEISLSPGGDVGATVSLGLVLPAVDVPALVARGLDATDMGVEVAWVWHRDGVLVHEWAAREVRLNGYAIEATHDDPGQPDGYVSLTVEDSPYRTERPVARWTWEVSAETWAASPENGARYPLVVGKPAPAGEAGGPPAPVVTQTGTPTNDDIVVSAGWCQAKSVTVVDSAGASDVLTIRHEADSLGQVVALVSVAGSALDDTDGITYTTAWTAGPALAPFGGTGPLHVAAYLLSLGGADIDLPAWISAAALLGLEVGGYMDDPESRAWEVARDLLAGLPVTMRRSRDGWAPVLLDPHLAASTVVETWDDDGPYRRASAWARTGGDRVSRVEVASGAPHVRVGDKGDRDAPLPHAWIRHLSNQQEAALDSSWAWRSAVAWRMAAWTARIGAMGWEASAWQVPAEWGRARAGDWIYLSADKRYALVQRRTLDGGVWDYTLVRPAGR